MCCGCTLQQPRPVETGWSMTSEPEESTPVRSSTSGGGAPTTAPNGSTYVNYQDDDECIDDAFEPGAVLSGADGAPTAAHSARLDSSGAGYASSRGAVATYTRCLALYGFEVHRRSSTGTERHLGMDTCPGASTRRVPPSVKNRYHFWLFKTCLNSTKMPSSKIHLFNLKT